MMAKINQILGGGDRTGTRLRTGGGNDRNERLGGDLTLLLNTTEPTCTVLGQRKRWTGWERRGLTDDGRRILEGDSGRRRRRRDH